MNRDERNYCLKRIDDVVKARLVQIKESCVKDDAEVSDKEDKDLLASMDLHMQASLVRDAVTLGNDDGKVKQMMEAFCKGF